MREYFHIITRWRVWAFLPCGDSESYASSYAFRLLFGLSFLLFFLESRHILDVPFPLSFIFLVKHHSSSSILYLKSNANTITFKTNTCFFKDILVSSNYDGMYRVKYNKSSKGHLTKFIFIQHTKYPELQDRPSIRTFSPTFACRDVLTNTKLNPH